MKTLVCTLTTALSSLAFGGVLCGGFISGTYVGDSVHEGLGLSDEEVNRLEFVAYVASTDGPRSGKTMLNSPQPGETPPFKYPESVREMVAPKFSHDKPLHCIRPPTGNALSLVEMPDHYLFIVPMTYTPGTLTLKQLNDFQLTDEQRKFWIGTRVETLCYFLVMDVANDGLIAPHRVAALRKEVGEAEDDEKLTMAELVPMLEKLSSGRFRRAMERHFAQLMESRGKSLHNMFSTAPEAAPAPVAFERRRPQAPKRSAEVNIAAIKLLWSTESRLPSMAGSDRRHEHETSMYYFFYNRLRPLQNIVDADEREKTLTRTLSVFNDERLVAAVREQYRGLYEPSGDRRRRARG